MKVTFNVTVNFPDDVLTPEQQVKFGAWIQDGAKRANYGITRAMIENAFEQATGGRMPKQAKKKKPGNIILPPDAGKISRPN
jgi:hypothetical protein